MPPLRPPSCLLKSSHETRCAFVRLLKIINNARIQRIMIARGRNIHKRYLRPIYASLKSFSKKGSTSRRLVYFAAPAELHSGRHDFAPPTSLVNCRPWCATEKRTETISPQLCFFSRSPITRASLARERRLRNRPRFHLTAIR